MTAPSFDAAAFRKRLAAAIRYRNTTLAKCSFESDVNLCTVSKALRGEGVPNLENFFRLCNWMGRSPAEFAANGKREVDG